MKTHSRVVIIVLNWNGKMNTLACLESLQMVSYPNFEIVIVDNGSSDGSIEAIRERFPDQTVIENRENLGFTGGNNVGLEYARQRAADYALLLNNDTEVVPDFLALLVHTMDRDPSIGAVGPMIYYYDRQNIIWSAGGRIDWQRGESYMIGLDQLDADTGWMIRDVDFVSGCAFLVRMSVLERVGVLDERFFAYFEETEWCVRIQRAGYRIVHVPEAKIRHKIPPEDGRAKSPTTHYYMTRNRLLFLGLAGVGLSTWLNVLVVRYLKTCITWTLRARWRNKRTQRDAMVRAICDALRGRWGKAPVFTTRGKGG